MCAGFKPHLIGKLGNMTNPLQSNSIMLSRPITRVSTLPRRSSDTISCFVGAVLGLCSLLVLVDKLGLERTQIQYSEQPVCEKCKEHIEGDEGEQNTKVPRTVSTKTP